MKKGSLLILALLLSIIGIQAQNNPGDNYQGRLYRLCKVWGFAKYYHSKVSACQVNWDNALQVALPQVKSATDSIQFNAAVLQMLQSAGPMDLATTPPPIIDSSLAVNVDFGWINDPYFSDSVRTILDTIRNNFRPHDNCYYEYSNYAVPGGNSYLIFPGDSIHPITGTYPPEAVRLLMTFRYWNILKYFNPNSRMLDIPWDTTLLLNILDVANAANAQDLYRVYLNMQAKLNDTHTQSVNLSHSNYYGGFYFPPFIMQYIGDGYVVTKSDVPLLAVGDVVNSIDGLSIGQWEDSMQAYISASNIAAFRRDLIKPLLAGPNGSAINISKHDSTQASQSVTTARSQTLIGWDTTYLIATYLTNTTWEIIGCNTGYVNIANILPADAINIFDSLRNTDNIIIDMRHGSLGASFVPYLENGGHHLQSFVKGLSISNFTIVLVLSVRYNINWMQVHLVKDFG